MNFQDINDHKISATRSKTAGFSVKTKLYFSANEPHVSALVL